MKPYPEYKQLSLFDDDSVDQTTPVTEPEKGATSFELLYNVIKHTISKSESYSATGQRDIDIIRQRYIDGTNETKIAQNMGLSKERIRQIRMKFIDSLMNPESKDRLRFEHAERLLQSAADYIGQDPAKTVTTRHGLPLPYSLLDFVDMLYFHESEYANQAFIAPKDQADCLRIHNHYLVVELRNYALPIEIAALKKKLKETITKNGYTYCDEYIDHLIKGNHWIEEADGLITVKYESLNLPVQKMKRIIYEQKKIHKKELVRIYNERETAHRQAKEAPRKELNVVLVI